MNALTRADLIAAITGKVSLQEVSEVAGPGQQTSIAGHEKPALVVRRLQTVHLPNVDLTARAGRVLGLYGLVGSGRSRFLRSLIGIEPLVDGSITLFGQPYRPRSPRHAAQRGVILVTEDRKRDGFIPQLDANLNVALPVLKDFVKLEWLRRGLMRRDTSLALKNVNVRGNLDGPTVRLSDGNQQKVLFRAGYSPKAAIASS